MAIEAILSDPLSFYISQLVSIGEARSLDAILHRLQDEESGPAVRVRVVEVLSRLNEVGLVEFDPATGRIEPQRTNFRARYTGPVQSRLFPGFFARFARRAVADLVVNGYPPVMFCFSDDPETAAELIEAIENFRKIMRGIGEKARKRKVQGLRVVGLFNSRFLGADVDVLGERSRRSSPSLLRSLESSVEGVRIFSHDVRAVIGALKVVRASKTLDADPNLAEVLSHAILKLQESVAVFSQVGKTTSEPRRRTVSEVFQRVRILLSGMGADQVVLEADCGVSSGELAPIDPSVLEDLLLNLAKNGLEAAQGGIGEKRVRLSCTESADEILFRVMDTGPGLSETAYEEIMVRRRSFTTKDGGWGKGLLGVIQRLRQFGTSLEYYRMDSYTIFQFRLDRAR